MRAHVRARASVVGLSIGLGVIVMIGANRRGREHYREHSDLFEACWSATSGHEKFYLRQLMHTCTL
jgi:hypothetical protein